MLHDTVVHGIYLSAILSRQACSRDIYKFPHGSTIGLFTGLWQYPRFTFISKFGQKLSLGCNDRGVRTNTGSGSITGSDPVFCAMVIFSSIFYSLCTVGRGLQHTKLFLPHTFIPI